MSHYQYTDLKDRNTFRVILFRAGAWRQPLAGDVVIASLKDDVQYVALSYVWGSDETPHMLSTLNGKIPITDSLNSALHCLRSPERDVLLWADAVCINQAKNSEKSLQVRLMREIHSKAEQVYAYLGEEADKSFLACDLV